MNETDEQSTQEELNSYSFNQLLAFILDAAIVVLVYANLGLILANVL